MKGIELKPAVVLRKIKEDKTGRLLRAFLTLEAKTIQPIRRQRFLETLNRLDKRNAVLYYQDNRECKVEDVFDLLDTYEVSYKVEQFNCGG